MPIPAPRRSRELFEQFRRYDPALGLAGLVGQWDLAEVTPQQIQACVFARPPESDPADSGGAFDAAGQFVDALASDEFQRGIVGAVLEAYPEKQRKIFIHIPKCAGTHLSEKLSADGPALNFRWMENNWIDKNALFEALRKLTLRLEGADAIFSYGHLRLEWYTSRRLIRGGDWPFAVVRDPAETVLSQVNYMLTRYKNDPELKAVDTRGWLDFLDREKVAAAVAKGEMGELAAEILFSDKLLPRNLICGFLGRGTAATALELCASAGVELTDMRRYPQWLGARLGVEPGAPVNVSHRYISLDTLGQNQLERIRALTEQDNIFVDKVRGHMDQTGRCWTSGAQLL